MTALNYTHGQVEVFREDMLWCLPVNRTVAEVIAESMEDAADCELDMAA